MKSMSNTRKLCVAAICVALCAVLPPAFHMIGAGSTFSPLHFPVLLCGILCGPLYGALCGIAGPLLSHLVSAMPAAPQLISMIPELIAYGVVSGILFKLIRTGKLYANVYLSLIPAMILGRIIGGIVKALVFISNAETYSISLWVSSYFVKTLPGIIAQLIVIPLLIIALIETKAIPLNEVVKTHE